MNSITRKLTSWRENDTAILAKWSLLPLVIIIAWLSAQLFWQIGGMFSTEQISTSIQSNNHTQGISNSEYDISRVVERHIFGDAGKVAVMTTVAPEIVDEEAPETRLNLKLRGIYASTDESRSNAIIEVAGGEQDLYFINDSIPGERNLSLARVFVDRVILKRNGKFETLKMDDFSEGLTTKTASNNRRSNKSDKKKLIDRRNNRQLTKQLSKIKQQMVNDPTSLAGLMNVNPKMVNGEFIGFSISPGKDASLFARSGLRRNDLITSVNGIVLDEPSKAISLIEEIRNAQELSIELTRGGKPLSLIYNLNDDNQ